jgi:CTP:molybdopterin cytidylyltransferase MocA
MPVPAIVLAAGASRRLGQPKQLVDFKGESLLARALRTAHEAGAAPVFVILGAHAGAIEPLIHPDDAILVRNDAWEQGISTSIHAGLRALESLAVQPAGAMLMTCDQPHLTAAHLRALIDAFEAHGSSIIVASHYAGIDGVPAVFPRAVFANLNVLHGDKGARAVIADASCPVVSIAFEGGEVDIDSPADMAQLR